MMWSLPLALMAIGAGIAAWYMFKNDEGGDDAL